MVKLVFLGKFGDVAPADLAKTELPSEVRTLHDLKAWLTRTRPLLGQTIAATQTRLILNQSVVHDLSTPVREGDEIAFLPPMSGG